MVLSVGTFAIINLLWKVSYLGSCRAMGMSFSLGQVKVLMRSLIWVMVGFHEAHRPGYRPIVYLEKCR